jgi:hypothetical protein
MKNTKELLFPFNLYRKEMLPKGSRGDLIKSLEDISIPIKGFFDSSLKQIPEEAKICFLHIDADLYTSVIEVLEILYHRVVDGGVIIIDDFFHHAQGPKRAAWNFFNRLKACPLYHVSFPYSVFLFKGKHSHLKNQHRSLDGNYYSFDFLKFDSFFVNAVQTCLAKTNNLQSSESISSRNCEMLLKLLRSDETRSSDVYLYWKALEDYWDYINPIEIMYGGHNQRDLISL